MRRLTLSFIVLAFIALGVMLGQRADITVDVQEIEVPTTVKVGKEFVSGLELRDFRLFDNNHSQNFKLDFTAVPISLVVAIQGDQNVEHFLPQIKTVGPLIENLIIGEAGEASLLVFDHRMRWVQDWTNDGKLFTKALAGVKPGSTTSAMVDAVFEATRKLRARPANRRRVLLLISETRDRGSEGNLREALEEVQNRDISIYTVNVNRLITAFTGKAQPPRPDPFAPGQRPRINGASPTSTGAVSGTVVGVNAVDLLPLIIEGFKQAKSLIFENTSEVFTRYTGGREYPFNDARGLETALTDIGEELHAQYLLTYAPSKEARAEGGWHEIRVLASDKTGRKYEVRARPGYWGAAKFK
jgi:VWFA-related protein